MLKNNEMVKESDKKELQQEDVNVYAPCSTNLKFHCLNDCYLTGGCFLTCAD